MMISLLMMWGLAGHVMEYVHCFHAYRCFSWDGYDTQHTILLLLFCPMSSHPMQYLIWSGHVLEVVVSPSYTTHNLAATCVDTVSSCFTSHVGDATWPGEADVRSRSCWSVLCTALLTAAPEITRHFRPICVLLSLVFVEYECLVSVFW